VESRDNVEFETTLAQGSKWNFEERSLKRGNKKKKGGGVAGGSRILSVKKNGREKGGERGVGRGAERGKRKSSKGGKHQEKSVSQVHSVKKSTASVKKEKKNHVRVGRGGWIEWGNVLRIPWATSDP